jgi:hypothetical protein
MSSFLAASCVVVVVVVYEFGGIFQPTQQNPSAGDFETDGGGNRDPFFDRLMQQHPDGKRETDCSPQVQTQMVIADQQRPSVSTTRWNKYVQTKSGHYFFQKEFPYFVV